MAIYLARDIDEMKDKPKKFVRFCLDSKMSQ